MHAFQLGTLAHRLKFEKHLVLHVNFFALFSGEDWVQTKRRKKLAPRRVSRAQKAASSTEKARRQSKAIRVTPSAGFLVREY